MVMRVISWPPDMGQPAVTAEIELPDDWRPVIGLFQQPDVLLVRAWAVVQRAFGLEPTPEKASWWDRFLFSLCRSQHVRLGLRLKPDEPIGRIDLDPLDGWHEDYFMITAKGELVHRQNGASHPDLYYKATLVAPDAVASASPARQDVSPGSAAGERVCDQGLDGPADSPSPTPERPKRPRRGPPSRSADIIAAFAALADELVWKAPTRSSLYEAVRDEIPGSRTAADLPARDFSNKALDRHLKEPFEKRRRQRQKDRDKKTNS
jgi:hypothetical protein